MTYETPRNEDGLRGLRRRSQGTCTGRPDATLTIIAMTIVVDPIPTVSDPHRDTPADPTTGRSPGDAGEGTGPAQARPGGGAPPTARRGRCRPGLSSSA